MISEREKFLLKNIEKLELQVKELTSINKFLSRKVTELEDKLNIDSSNSGLPTSKEVYKREKKSRPKSNRKIGGQPCHAYNGYKRKDPDKIIEVMPDKELCSCGASLELSNKYTTHQKVEIPKIIPYVEEYRMRRKVCSKCNRSYRGRLNNYRILGTNAQSILSSLGGFFNNSKRDLQLILSQIFNMDISLGLISNSEKRVSGKLEGSYNQLVKEARENPSLNIDETGHNNQGNRYWCWVLASQTITLFKLANSRGSKVLKVLLPSYNGKVISDRYAVYNCFDSKKRQICLAHLRRDFKRFAHSSNAMLSRFGYTLLHNLDLVFTLYNEYKDGKIQKMYFLSKIKKVQKKIYLYLRKVRFFSYSKQAHRVARNILKSFDMMWLFTTDLTIPPTNNLAERQIKNHVKYRKNSFFTWSDRGDRFLERIKSIYATSKLRNSNPFLTLSALIQDSS